jgi:hypothetical protein
MALNEVHKSQAIFSFDLDRSDGIAPHPMGKKTGACW